MGFKYEEENIPNTIATAILEYEKRSKRDRAHYSEIHRRIKSLLGHPISKRQFGKHLEDMVREKILIRFDPTGKRGARVQFWLTEKGKKRYDLKILGSSIDVERRKRFYGLLISFEVYKRGPLLTEKQLRGLLKAVGSSMNDFRRSLTQAHHFPGSFYKYVKGIDILGIPGRDHRTKSSKMWYYTVIPGFSVEEFVAYQKAIKSGREPRPFTSSRTLVPFALLESYTKKEVKEAIVLLEGAGLIKPVQSVIPGEKRYNIMDKSIRSLVRALWLVRMIDIELLSGRLLLSKPTERDRKYMRIYVGEWATDRIIAHAHEIRRSKKEGRQTQEVAIREIGELRAHLVEITSKFDKVVRENEIIRDIVEEICNPPFLSSDSNQL